MLSRCIFERYSSHLYLLTLPQELSDDLSVAQEQICVLKCDLSHGNYPYKFIEIFLHLGGWQLILALLCSSFFAALDKYSSTEEQLKTAEANRVSQSSSILLTLASQEIMGAKLIITPNPHFSSSPISPAGRRQNCRRATRCSALPHHRLY